MDRDGSSGSSQPSPSVQLCLWGHVFAQSTRIEQSTGRSDSGENKCQQVRDAKAAAVCLVPTYGHVLHLLGCSTHRTMREAAITLVPPASTSTRDQF